MKIAFNGKLTISIDELHEITSEEMSEAVQRLKELGWNDAIYCPKDGSEFDAIEAGSTGIHRCHYDGEWPNGHWWVADNGDLWPSRPILFRKTPNAELRRSADEL